MFVCDLELVALFINRSQILASPNLFKFSMFYVLFLKVGVKKRRNERRKRQKAIKKKARLMTRTKQMMEMTEAISNLKAKCVATQSSLDSSNKAIGILKRKYQTLKELMSQSKVNLVKEIRQDQLLVVKDSHNNEIVLGQGRCGICKLIFVSQWGIS